MPDKDVTRAQDNPRHHLAFVMTQTTGNVTYYKNLRSAIDADPSVGATWYPLTYQGPVDTGRGQRHRWAARVSSAAWPALRHVAAIYPHDALALWASLRARRMLARADAANRFAVLFFHTEALTLLSRRFMHRIPTVVSLDSTPCGFDALSSSYGSRAMSGIPAMVKQTAYRRLFRIPRAFVAWSNWVRQSLIADYGVDSERITVIPPGVNLDLWPQPAPRDDAGPVRILFVGGDFVRKGGDILLQAFARVRDRYQCELHLVTTAPVKQFPGVFIYHDVAPNSDVLRHLYATADLFVLPTIGDCFSVASIEAAASGLAVITCPVGGIPDIVQHERTGLLVPPGDVRAHVAAMSALMSDPSKRRAMGTRGRALVEQRFDNTVNVRRILSIMTCLAEGNEASKLPLCP